MEQKESERERYIKKQRKHFTEVHGAEAFSRFTPFVLPGSTSQKCMEQKVITQSQVAIMQWKHFTEVHGAEDFLHFVCFYSKMKHFTEVHGAEEVVYSGLFPGS